MSEPRWDHDETWQIDSHRVLATGRVCDFVNDRVITPAGEQVDRQYITHPGAVGIIALDDRDRVAVVRQYRQPVRMVLVEPPAGLLDVDGEGYLHAAQRELAEEARLAASDWRVLVDVFTSPGGAQESLRIFLARDLRPAPLPDGFVLEGEEVTMSQDWEPLDDLVEAVYAGQCQSPTMVAGVLALALARSRGSLDALRPADSPWPVRERRGGLTGLPDWMVGAGPSDGHQEARRASGD
ncbi:MAG: NUDIX hydrolase [Acidipropionibacterium acidipropionici]|jgi:ADP-ribose pyrophosphatase|uniref:Hydrolase, NUDIX family n=1 Tax=Acidipropionibacterium acidipropionici (strain ATCC 4875 / DSM 20272 / JCM 6432 / NBRC 12425 / NCIMB 8070 / 4) TaxID=1171373 RepID=K7RPH4_ACIA4|nr:NUDIX hydrolase [Acidipropionibacterium acidipropionici]AFV89874.1 Hydrolase, NUDIX family [Acidipropionibacterium acidipropionici ATCC 4875]AZP38221.1 NUDIX hydrolase [Acidipropionibacterium acidipropionici]